MPRRACNDLDHLIGLRIRWRRKALRMSQQTLATALGISFQQLQKYENGKNKIAASTLTEIAYQLQMPIAWFDGMHRQEVREACRKGYTYSCAYVMLKNKDEYMQTETVTKKATNISLDQGLLNEAKALGVNISQASEDGVQRAVASLKAEQWQQENRAALQSSNDWVKKHGLPLEQFRQF